MPLSGPSGGSSGGPINAADARSPGAATVPGAVTGPRNPCAICGRCCTSYIVNLCGYDVWLLSTRQRLAPEQFVVAIERDPPGPEGFHLEPGGPAFALMLDKQGRLHPKQPCVFLLRLADGSQRCGVYAHRPLVCQTYPMSQWSGVVFQRAEALCPPGSWPVSSIQHPSWRDALQRMRAHYDVYYEVVARWNAHVTDAGQGAWFPLHDYLSYLMNVYDRLAALDAATGEEALARIYATWGSLPSLEASSVPKVEEVRVRVDQYPWLAYLSAARDIIDGFYPEIPPLPVLALRSQPALAPPDTARPGRERAEAISSAGAPAPRGLGGD